MTTTGPTAGTAQPDVTVLISTRDRLALLREALASLWAQDYAGDVHVICVFDGPIPADADLPAPPRPTWSLRVEDNEEHPGLARARNKGLALVGTGLVALCDDDDRWLPGKLRAQVALLQQRPDAVCAGGGIRVLSGDRTVERPAPADVVNHSDLLRDRIMELHPSTLLMRTGALREVGGWDEHLPGGYAEDYDLLLRLARAGSIVLVEEIVAEIVWAGQSHYFSKWPMIAAALDHLLAKHPEFATSPRGRARIEGQIAFALSASGRHAEAKSRLRRVRRDNPWEPRAVLARLVGGSPARAEFVQRRLHAYGRGI
ncbi:glycosyltransferase family 2 protein [Nocardioides panacisoli]|uniref:glycosyltransferase family 2 protein n=1 Tax=Nocardioides panacisoli TaxID=627624 RepID=UPI001C63419C|nr:glycosyltransferase family A protein [Nocardioides panacisoli]QYJ02976.1 glycosyltransferase family 2 protein [Nocardioides panacisoli]